MFLTSSVCFWLKIKQIYFLTSLIIKNLFLKQTRIIDYLEKEKKLCPLTHNKTRQLHYYIPAEGPGVSRGFEQKNILKKNVRKNRFISHPQATKDNCKNWMYYFFKSL